MASFKDRMMHPVWGYSDSEDLKIDNFITGEGEIVDWSSLPEDLLQMIAVRLFSVIELLRFRGICKTWRSSVSSDYNPFPPRPLIHLNPLIVFPDANLNLGAFLSRATYYHVTLSSSPGKGWLIKSDKDVNSEKLHLVNPLSRFEFPQWALSINLLAVTVSEIREAYVVKNRKKFTGFKRVVLVTVERGHRMALGIGFDGKIRYWNGEIWTRLKDQLAQFSDIIVHKRQTYALDSHGIVWWISSSLTIFRYGALLDENISIDCCSEKRFVECCGELYIVDRLRKRIAGRSSFSRIDQGYTIHDNAGNEYYTVPEWYRFPTTVGFKVYKINEDLGKWVEVKSLADRAFLMATDCSFSVLAHDFYGCLQNSIYFTDDEHEIRVFKLDDDSITTTDGTTSQTCFELFVPTIL